MGAALKRMFRRFRIDEDSVSEYSDGRLVMVSSDFRLRILGKSPEGM